MTTCIYCSQDIASDVRAELMACNLMTMTPQVMVERLNITERALKAALNKLGTNYTCMVEEERIRRMDAMRASRRGISLVRMGPALGFASERSCSRWARSRGLT